MDRNVKEFDKIIIKKQNQMICRLYGGQQWVEALCHGANRQEDQATYWNIFTVGGIGIWVRHLNNSCRSK